MRNHAALLAVIALHAMAAPARAERPLTLEEALHLARAGNRDLAQARARLAQARASVKSAWVALLPTVAAQGRYTRNYTDVNLSLDQIYAPTIALATAIKGDVPSASAVATSLTTEAAAARNIEIQKVDQVDLALTAQVPLLVPSAWAALDGARKNLASAEAGDAATEASLLLAAAQSFFGAAGADELVLAQRNAVGVARELAERAREKYAAGSGKRVDQMRAELAATRAAQALEEALDAREQAYRAVGTICQIHEPFTVTPPLVQAPGDSDDRSGDQLVKMALAARPEVFSLEQAVAARDASMRSHRLRWAPSLSAFGNLRGFNYRSFNGDLYAWAVGLQLDWVLYDGGARDGAHQLAAAQRDELAARLAGLRDAVSDEVQNHRRRAITKRKALDAATRSVELAGETLRLVRIQHAEGIATQLDLLGAQDALVAAEVSVAQARFDLALAVLTLQRDVGQFPPRAL